MRVGPIRRGPYDMKTPAEDAGLAGEVSGAIRLRRPVLHGQRLDIMEFVDGSVYANIRQLDRVVRIDPESGAVTGWLDLFPIAERERRAGEADVTKGIARDGSTLYVTAKLWRSVYGLELLR